MTPLPNQHALWHGLNDLPGQQDLFDCDLGPAIPSEPNPAEAESDDNPDLSELVWECGEPFNAAPDSDD